MYGVWLSQVQKMSAENYWKLKLETDETGGTEDAWH